MKIILTTDVANVGQAGDVVDVKDGYGRNYLLPQGLAIPATIGAQKQIAGIKRAQSARTVRDLAHANEIKQNIENLNNVTIGVKTADSGKLFGSVTPSHVVSAIKDAGGPVIDKRAVSFPQGHVKSTGTVTVAINIHPSVRAQIPVTVAAAQ